MNSLDDWLDYIAKQHTQTIDMGLERMREVMLRLELARPASQIVTVAGTNGKGSTCVALEQLLLGHGRTVGTSLSPHISRFNERIRVNGAEVDDATICAAFGAIDAARGQTPLTYFEFGALAALWCFKQAGVATAVLEIGLGGRLDAFNAVDADVAVITSIGFDHQEYLGDTLDEIGAEKAGILRPGAPAVLGADMPASVLRACDELAIDPLRLGKDFDYECVGNRWGYGGNDIELCDIELGSIAPHNLSVAFTALTQLVEPDLHRSREIMGALEMPGRMSQRIIDQRRYLFDVSHNPQGAAFCCAELGLRGYEPALIVCGMLHGKAHAAVHDIVRRELAAPWVFLSTYGDRAMSAGQLAKSIGGVGHVPCFDHFDEVRRHVRSATGIGDVILVFGSFSVVEQGELSAVNQEEHG